MQLIILLVVMSILGAFTIKCMKREDELIELEDKIISDVREFLHSSKRDSAKIEKVSCAADSSPSRAA